MNPKNVRITGSRGGLNFLCSCLGVSRVPPANIRSKWYSMLCHVFGQVERVTRDVSHLGNRSSWHTTWGASSNHLQTLKEHTKTAAIV